MKVTLLLAAAATVLATSAGAAPAVAALPTPASTQHALVLHDGPGDVWTHSDTTSGYEPATEPVADVLRARVTHGSYAVSVRMVFDELTRADNQWFYCDIHTTGLTRYFILEVTKGAPRGVFWQDVEGEWVRVPGISHHIDYAAHVVTLRITRSLLGDPPWVRVRLRNELGVGDGVFFTDNPMTADQNAAFTPRLTSP